MAKRTLIFVVILVGIFLPGYIKLKMLLAKEKELHLRIEQLKLENAKLQDEAKRLKNDPFYIEKVAREKYGLVKEGEIVYKVEP